MAKELTERKCSDCAHYKLTGWWDPEKSCEISDCPLKGTDPLANYSQKNPGNPGMYNT